MRWTKPSAEVHQSGAFEIYEVACSRTRLVYELCRGEEFLGTFRTLQLAKEAAEAELTVRVS